MKRLILICICVFSFLFCGCNNNQATVHVLETCKAVRSPIKETSISKSEEYFTITFDNGLFYVEDHTSGSTVYTIKIPKDKQLDTYGIIKSISLNITEEDFEKLETENKVSFFKAYRENWRITKIQEGDTIEYKIR